jgi:hypothetical protein
MIGRLRPLRPLDELLRGTNSGSLTPGDPLRPCPNARLTPGHLRLFDRATAVRPTAIRLMESCADLIFEMFAPGCSTIASVN